MKLSLDTLEKVKCIIRDSFAGVVLGEGLGLYEANAIDDYQTKESQAEFREKDEKLDWTKLTEQAVNDGFSSLSFFDPAGMRFHLPAYMIMDLDQKYNYSLIHKLTSVCNCWHEMFGLLTNEQKSRLEDIYPRDNDDFSKQENRSLAAQRSAEQFALLTKEQKKAVCTYLEFSLTLDTLHFTERLEIPIAIRDFWSK